jgi:small subunit ribosomal protein S17
MKDSKPFDSSAIQGKVVSNAMTKTVVMEVETKKMHPRFHKITTKTSRIKVHDENNECQVGDVILAIETRKLSKDKHHRLVKIVEKSKI